MTRAALAVAFIAAAAIAAAAAAAEGSAAIEVAAISGSNALVAGPLGGRLAVLATGGAGRGIPAISPDGTQIAYAQNVDSHVALSDVVVVGRDGREISRTHVEPVLPGIGYTGMRTVEALRWVAPGRLVVRGGINPAQSQYYLIDAAAGRVVADFIDDDSAAAFSPDGLHVATLSGSPHYTPASEQAPELLVDDKPVWSPAAGTSLAAPPRFSPDSSALAWVARDAAGKATLGLWHGGKAILSPLPAGAEATLHIYWAGGKAVATAGANGPGARMLAWSADASGAGLTPQPASDPATAAQALHDKLARQASAAGLADADFWCTSCSLALLPRGTE